MMAPRPSPDPAGILPPPERRFVGPSPRSLQSVGPMGQRLWRGPRLWRRRLIHISVPALLNEIQTAILEAPALELSLRQISHWVRRRTLWTICWRRRRCLLSGLLYADLLPRAGYSVTVHLGCRLNTAADLVAHCWISSPDTEEINRLMSSQGMTEMFRRTLHPSRRPKRQEVWASP